MFWILLIVVLLVAGFYWAGAHTELVLNQVTGHAPDSVSPHAQALHDGATVVDLHADSLLFGRDLLERGKRGHVDLPRLQAGGIGLQVFTIVTKAPFAYNSDETKENFDMVTVLAAAQRWPSIARRTLRGRVLYQAERFDLFAERSSGMLQPIRNRADLDALLEARRQDPQVVGGILGIEGTHALEQGLDDFELFYRQGVRLMGLTHFVDSSFAGSAHSAAKGGLTQLGRELVKRMTDRGVLIDLAHTSERTIEDVLEIVSIPVMVSHTGVRGTLDNNRNLSDAQIRAIAANGGVMGIGFWDEAVGEPSTRAIVKAIRYVVDLVGDEHVSLGSDWDGTVTTPIDASGMARLTEELVCAGFTDETITKILGLNALRVIRAGLSDDT